MKTAAVVSFKSFLLFVILLMIMRLGEAVPAKDVLKEGASDVGGKYSSVRKLSYVSSLFSLARSRLNQPAPGSLLLPVFLSVNHAGRLAIFRYFITVPNGN